MVHRASQLDYLVKTPVENNLGDRSMSDRAYEKILTMIAQGRIAVGEKLPTENTLSEQLQVSRPILRKALKQLREDEVIVSRQGSGSFVMRRPDAAAFDFAPIGSIADIQRTFEFRSAIESEAASLAAQRRTDADVTKLSASIDELDRCVREGELGVDADETFHADVCIASGNSYFYAARISMKSNILMGMNLMRNLSLTKPQDHVELVQNEHHAIFDAIVQQNAENARIAMRTHVDNARRRVFSGSTI